MPSWWHTSISARSGSLGAQIDRSQKVGQAMAGEADLAVLRAYQKEGDSRQSESEPNIQLKM